MDMIQTLAQELNKDPRHVENVVRLLDEGNTIPFIARYRKELHGAMDDTSLRTLEERLQYLRGLEERRDTVKKSIEEQGKLTEELAAAIDSAQTLAEVEDLYRPYKQKRRTRATVAREKGLEPLAALLFAQERDCPRPEDAAAGFIDSEKGVETAADALQGANDIIAEWISDDAVIRKSLRIPRAVWRGCAVTAAVCCLVVVGAKCDLTGYARRIPDTAQVKSARIICNGYSSALTEAENIQAVEDIHRAVVAEREKITDDTSITSLQLTYKLTNGKVLMREYTLPDTSTRLAQIEQVLNCDEARATRNTPELAVTLEHLTYANIGYEAESGDYLYVELTAEQALDLYENAIVPDCADGTMGRAWLTDSGTRQSTAYAVTIGYQLSQYDPATGETTYANVDYTPLTDSTRTLAWLRAHDIKPLLEGDSIKYGGEPDTQPAINTYETTDSSFGR